MNKKGTLKTMNKNNTLGNKKCESLFTQVIKNPTSNNGFVLVVHTHNHAFFGQ